MAAVERVSEQGFADWFRTEMPSSLELWTEASRTLPAGVGSSARGTRAGWEPYPPFITSGSGSRLFDADGHEYVDFLLGLGPMLLGHRPPAVTRAVVRAIEDSGTVFGLPNELESVAAAKVVEAVPSVDMVRFSSSGSEAVGTAVRLARAFTGRPKILRFEGMYHGWMDTVYWSNHPDLTKAGPDRSPVPVPAGRGLPEELRDSLIVLPWNDPEAIADTMHARGDEIAAVITEPVMLNTGCILPEPGYLELLRTLTEVSGSLLIFDEVITGFRLSRGGAQELFGVMPDLTTMAKGLGGGFPVAAIGGKREVMELVADGRYSHSGTYNSNAIAAAAVSATMDELADPTVYDRIRALGARLRDGIDVIARELEIPAHTVGIGPVLQTWFTDRPIRNYREAERHARPDRFTTFWQNMFRRGVLFHPGQFENLFVSTAHSEDDVERTLSAVADSMRAARRDLGGG
ncbi:MAG: aspartate aminotransferase family protein [Actinomycetota bacterium]|nr:aspartate aminotransferase family protein [Actinomycetota bacterium]